MEASSIILRKGILVAYMHTWWYLYFYSCLLLDCLVQVIFSLQVLKASLLFFRIMMCFRFSNYLQFF